MFSAAKPKPAEKERKMKKTAYTYEQHDKLGLELQIMCDRLIKIQTELGRAYPIILACKVEPAWKAVAALRDALENKIIQEHPDNPEAKTVYHRSNRTDYKKPE